MDYVISNSFPKMLTVSDIVYINVSLSAYLNRVLYDSMMRVDDNILSVVQNMTFSAGYGYIQSQCLNQLIL